MKKEGIGLTDFVGKIRPVSLGKMQAKENAGACDSDTTANEGHANVNNSYSFPMSEMKKIAIETMIEANTSEIHIPVTAKRQDRIHIARRKTRSIFRDV